MLVLLLCWQRCSRMHLGLVSIKDGGQLALCSAVGFAAVVLLRCQQRVCAVFVPALFAAAGWHATDLRGV